MLGDAQMDGRRWEEVLEAAAAELHVYIGGADGGVCGRGGRAFACRGPYYLYRGCSQPLHNGTPTEVSGAPARVPLCRVRDNQGPRRSI